MATPLVSVIIPAYNAAAWLPDCLDSVFRQTYANREIFVIDDGSTDTTPNVLRAFAGRVQLLRQARGGIGAARNAGLARAAGEYVAFLDSDDLWRSDKLEKQVRHAHVHPDLAVIHSDAEEFDERGTLHASYFDLAPGLRKDGDPFERLVHFCIPLTSSTLVKRTFLREHSLSFLEPVSGVEDLGLFLEIAAKGGRFGFLDE